MSVNFLADDQTQFSQNVKNLFLLRALHNKYNIQKFR